jgi:secondary thiamine-phosphate synthase enzyme
MDRRKAVVIEVSTVERDQLVDITKTIDNIVRESGVGTGSVRVFVPHTTAGVTINEHADPAVAKDILAFLDSMVPWKGTWRHGEGNSAAHIKASLMGSAVVAGISGGALELGTWQGIFFCEFDGPRNRKVRVAVEGSAG